jgi:hypothetical protein
VPETGSAGALRNLSGNNTVSAVVTLGSDARINSDAGLLTLDVTTGNAITASAAISPRARKPISAITIFSINMLRSLSIFSLLSNFLG